MLKRFGLLMIALGLAVPRHKKDPADNRLKKSLVVSYTMAAAFVFGSLLASPLSAEQSNLKWRSTPSSSVSGSPWQFSIGSFGWLPDAPVDIIAGGRTISFDEDLSTIVESAEFALEFELTARKGPLKFSFATIYYDGEYDDVQTGPLGTVRTNVLEEQAWLINYGISYEIGSLEFGNGVSTSSVSFSPFLGATYFNDDVTLTATPGFISPQFSFDTTVEFHTPIIGLDTIWRG